MAHTHTLPLVFFFKCAAGISASFFFFFLLAEIALQDDVHGDVLSSLRFHLQLSPIFWLAQILQRADLGDEPEHPLEVAVQPAGALINRYY